MFDKIITGEPYTQGAMSSLTVKKVTKSTNAFNFFAL